MSCGGCEDFKMAHNKWVKFITDVDEVIPLITKPVESSDSGLGGQQGSRFLSSTGLIFMKTHQMQMANRSLPMRSVKRVNSLSLKAKSEGIFRKCLIGVSNTNRKIGS
jgi:hypothetical protein